MDYSFEEIEFTELFIKYDCLVRQINNIPQTQYFASLSNSEKKLKDLDTILLFLELSKNKVASLCKVASKYDPGFNIKANGFRSIIKIFEKCVDLMLYSASKIKFDVCKLYSTSKEHLKKILEWKKFLIFFYPVYCISENMTVETSPGSLFLEQSHSLNLLTNNLSLLIHPCFYGKNLGFQFAKKIQFCLNSLATAMASFSYGFDNSTVRILQTAIAVTKNGYYSLKPKVRSRKLVRLCTSPSVDFCKFFWSLLDNYGLQYLPLFVGPFLKVCRPHKLEILPLEMTSRHDSSKFTLFDDAYESKKHLPKLVMTRILSSHIYEGFIKVGLYRLYGLFEKARPNSSTLLIHIHGGGFIARSPQSSEIYLRSWAQTLSIPILSIDYSLSPESLFPVAVEESFYVYCWALSNYEALGFTGENIILVGDSAGANLIISVVQKAITTGVKLPVGMVCLYPVTNLTDSLSPSRLLSTIDILLGAGFLKACKNAYFGLNRSSPDIMYNPMSQQTTIKHYKRSISYSDSEYNLSLQNMIEYIKPDARAIPFYVQTINEKTKSFSTNHLSEEAGHVYDAVKETCENMTTHDPLASPLFLDSAIISQFPPTTFILADMDPLLDDGIEFCRKLKNNGVSVSLKIMEDLPHGFLEFSSIVPDAKIATNIVLQHIQEYINGTKTSDTVLNF